jgi:hypothetical protein
MKIMTQKLAVSSLLFFCSSHIYNQDSLTSEQLKNYVSSIYDATQQHKKHVPTFFWGNNKQECSQCCHDAREKRTNELFINSLIVAMQLCTSNAMLIYAKTMITVSTL